MLIHEQRGYAPPWRRVRVARQALEAVAWFDEAHEDVAARALAARVLRRLARRRRRLRTPPRARGKGY